MKRSLLIYIFLLSFKGFAQDSANCLQPVWQDIPPQKPHKDTIKTSQFSIEVDQDFLLDPFFPNLNWDRNYTQGTAFTFISDKVNESALITFQLLLEKVKTDLLKIGPKREEYYPLPGSISLGVTAFTPREIDSNNPVVGDRPFANVLYLSSIRNKYKENRNREGKVEDVIALLNGKVISNEVSIGIIGSNVAYQFQSFAHKHIVTGRPVDISWNHQISNGGRPAFLFNHSVQNHIVSFKNYRKRGWFEMSSGYNLHLGWYTGVSGNISVNIGNFNTNHTLLSQSNISLGTKSHAPGYYASEEEKTEKNTFNWFFFVKIQPRITPYNSLVLGQPFSKSVYTLDPNDYNPIILDFSSGLNLNFTREYGEHIKIYDLILSFNSRTSEIRNPIYNRTHSWGRIVLRFPV